MTEKASQNFCRFAAAAVWIWIIGVRIAWYMQNPDPVWAGDTSTYVNYSFSELLKLNFSHRTPVYPFILRICKIIFEDHYLTVVVILQNVVSVISIYFLNRTIKIITRNDWIALFIIFAFGNDLGIIRWDQYILTESFSVSVATIWLYFIVCYIYNPKVTTGVSTVAITFIMTFLKPAFLIWNIFLLAFFVLRFIIYKYERVILKKTIVACIGTLCLIGIYCGLYKVKNGVFNITNQAPRHLITDLLISDLYKAYPDKELVNKIEDIYLKENEERGLYAAAWAVLDMFGDNSYSQNSNALEFGKVCIKNDFEGYVKYIAKKIILNSGWKFWDNWNSIKYKNSTIKYMLIPARYVFNFMRSIYLWGIGAAEAAYCIYYSVKFRKIPWIHFGIFILLLINLLFIYIGTYDEFIRSSVYVLPFAYCSIGVFMHGTICKLCLHKN